MHLLRTEIACGTPVGAGTAYPEQVTCPECLSHRDPFPMIRRFAELVGPVPPGYQELDGRDWQLQADKVGEESAELMFALMAGVPQSVDTLLCQTVEMMDTFIAACVLLCRQGIDPQKALATVIRYNHLRAAHGMEGGEFVHSEEIKRQLKDEMFAELTAVIWGRR
jgi:phosphoribosyl-ATP pyrophosphohydrolase